MKRSYPVEFVYQAASLIVAVILVHLMYVLVVRPNAELVLSEQQIRLQSDPGYVPQRSVWVIVRDYEQEACFVLMIWALAIMAYKGLTAVREQRLLETDFVSVGDGTRILPEDAREYARRS